MQMSTGISILQGTLGVISMLYPPAAPFIAIAEKAAPYLIAAIPLIEAGIKEGPGAFAAVQAAAPELTAQIRAIATQASSLGVSFGSTDAGHIENVTRAMFSLPQMTHDQEMAWMNAATPHNDPSQENSQFGG